MPRKRVSKSAEEPTKKKAKKSSKADDFVAVFKDASDLELEQALDDGQLEDLWEVLNEGVTAAKLKILSKIIGRFMAVAKVSSDFDCRTLSFLWEQNTEMWKKVWTNLLLEGAKTDEDLLIVARAWGIFLNGSLKDVYQRCTGTSQLNSTELWHWIPTRRLELEVRRRKLDLGKKPKQIPIMVTLVSKVIDSIRGHNKDEGGDLNLANTSLELLVDLLLNKETRNEALVEYLDAVHFQVYLVEHHKQIPVLTRQLCERVRLAINFGNVLEGKNAQKRKFHDRASILQKMCHRHFKEQCADLVFASVGHICQAKSLQGLLSGMTDDEVRDLLYRMRLIEEGDKQDYSRSFCVQVLRHFVSIPADPLQELAEYPLYPTEKMLWDTTQVPTRGSTASGLALPKLTPSYLSFVDYLWRNFQLYQMESAYEIRSDLQDAIQRVKPQLRTEVPGFVEDTDDKDAPRTEFSGWARMALEISERLKITKVESPLLGQRHPRQVLAEFGVDLQPCGEAIRNEWDELGEFDNLFLVTIDAAAAADFEVGDDQSNEEAQFQGRFGVLSIRGCMIVNVKDGEGNSLSVPGHEMRVEPKGTKRVFTVALDPCQYRIDALDGNVQGSDVYRHMNLVVRRRGRENNFKAVLETIRSLLVGSGSVHETLPKWLHSVLMGQGSPSEASFDSDALRAFAADTVGVPDPEDALDFGDAILDEEHMKEALGDRVTINKAKETEKSGARLNHKLRFLSSGDIEASQYPSATTSGNQVKFTSTQMKAIRAGLSPGLCLVQGPPGTGKTDVAVQIIANLYHSFPTQRTVVISHSNAALNDIFQKIMARGDMEERYFVRLGAGERELQTKSTHDFTKVGRVAYSFSRRAELLEQVQQISESLGISGKAERGADGAPSYNCESAEHFYHYQVKKVAKKFEKEVSGGADTVKSKVFPFSAYFKLEDDNEISFKKSMEYVAALDSIFAELREYRPFELLRTARHRADYLLMKQARVVAMTCTHAALARTHLLKLGFEYDNLVVEEAGQMLEIESFIPLLLQKGAQEKRSIGASRLKRICLMGDHYQLPPIVKNASFARLSSLDQSMFARLIQMGTPHIQLDQQGRSRPEIANLYRWRYQGLGDLSYVTTEERFTNANAGLAYPVQLINVEDFDGKGESCPTPFFYQNFGEAEYSVALFQYLVLIGHPPEKISILTTYNGQKALISDIIGNRCGPGTALNGVRPKAIATVDQYQGQQNDIIILSLVRTKAVGHLRDIRRLIVAVSRARLGLYIFCRRSVFKNHSLHPTMSQFDSNPTKLQLVAGEQFPTTRKLDTKVKKSSLYEVDDAGHLGSMVFQLQEQLNETG